MTTPKPGDMGNFLAQSLLEAAQDAITAADLPMPQLIMQAGGTGVPTTDPCDGMLWTRVATVFPSYGDGSQFSEARIDWAVPSWCYPIELGVMFCHPVIDAEGASPDPKIWSGMAARDGDYRMALLDAVAYRYPPKIKTCTEGQRLEPWAPIGPEGGYSGGLLVSYTIANFLAV